jgi:Skp family chaperone for outer membrane proteins
MKKFYFAFAAALAVLFVASAASAAPKVRLYKGPRVMHQAAPQKMTQRPASHATPRVKLPARQRMLRVKRNQARMRPLRYAR